MSKKSNKMFGCSKLGLIAHHKIDIMVYHNYVGMYCDIYILDRMVILFLPKVDCKYSPCKLNEKEMIDMHIFLVIKPKHNGMTSCLQHLTSQTKICSFHDVCWLQGFVLVMVAMVIHLLLPVVFCVRIEALWWSHFYYHNIWFDLEGHNAPSFVVALFFGFACSQSSQ